LRRQLIKVSSSGSHASQRQEHNNQTSHSSEVLSPELSLEACHLLLEGVDVSTCVALLLRQVVLEVQQLGSLGAVAIAQAATHLSAVNSQV